MLEDYSFCSKFYEKRLSVRRARRSFQRGGELLELVKLTKSLFDG
jgi:hypothetical protein